MKMKPKVTTAMMLLFSAITAVESPFINFMSRSFPTQMESPIKGLSRAPECDNYDTINAWFSKQLRLSNILEDNILHLDTLLNTTCDFYENYVMQSLFENMEKIYHLNGDQRNREFPKMSGNLGKDLDKLLSIMKKEVPKGLKKHKCCEELEKSLDEVKEALQDKWEDMQKENAKDIEKDNAKIKEKLREEQESLGEQLEDVQMRLENIPEETGSKTNTKCCAKLNRKIKGLLKELHNLRDEANDNNDEFKEKLKKIQRKLDKEDKKAKDAGETLEKREKITKEMVDKFQMKTKGNDCAEKELEEKTKKLENLVKERADKFDSPANNLNITLCRENGEMLAKIEAQLEKLVKEKKERNSGNSGAEIGGAGTNNADGSPPETIEDRAKKLLEEAEKLRESLKNSESCCEKTEDLQGLGDNLLKSIDQMNEAYDEHIKNRDLDLDEIKSLLKEATDKLGSIKNDSTRHKDKSENEAGDDYQNQITNVQSELVKAKDDYKNLQNKLNELLKARDDFDKEFTKNFDFHMKALNVNWIKADEDIRYVEEGNRFHFNGLESLQKDISELEGEVGRLETQEKNNMEKLANMEKQITQCHSSCRDLDQMNDLMDQIEDWERFFKIKFATTKRTTRSNVMIGGIDAATATMPHG